VVGKGKTPRATQHQLSWLDGLDGADPLVTIGMRFGKYVSAVRPVVERHRPSNILTGAPKIGCLFLADQPYSLLLCQPLLGWSRASRSVGAVNFFSIVTRHLFSVTPTVTWIYPNGHHPYSSLHPY
jgi:hypothetical protein